MASLEMEGPYKLTSEEVNSVVTDKSPGNYALGRKDEEGVFLVGYVGRSDSDVRDRLLQWVGKTNYPLFEYSYADSVKAAFEKECKNYHDFKPPKNDVHPARPDGTNWKCPYCGIYD